MREMKIPGGSGSADMAKSNRQIYRCDVHLVSRQCGIRLFDGARQYRSSRGARECFSKSTLRRIGRTHGAAHLALVLRLIVETNGNASELYAETLTAVSALLCHNPRLADLGLALFEIFDQIDLPRLRRQAHDLPCGLPAGHIMRILLALQIESLSESSTGGL